MCDASVGGMYKFDDTGKRVGVLRPYWHTACNWRWRSRRNYRGCRFRCRHGLADGGRINLFVAVREPHVVGVVIVAARDASTLQTTWIILHAGRGGTKSDTGHTSGFSPRGYG